MKKVKMEIQKLIMKMGFCSWANLKIYKNNEIRNKKPVD